MESRYKLDLASAGLWCLAICVATLLLLYPQNVFAYCGSMYCNGPDAAACPNWCSTGESGSYYYDETCLGEFPTCYQGVCWYYDSESGSCEFLCWNSDEQYCAII